VGRGRSSIATLLFVSSFLVFVSSFLVFLSVPQLVSGNSRNADPIDEIMYDS